MKKCQHDKCKKEAISFSDLCGEHTDPVLYVKVLNAIDDLEKDSGISPLVFKDIELTGLKWDDKYIPQALFSDVSFVECNFTNVRWWGSKIINCYFEHSDFKNCFFKRSTEIQGTSFDECILYECNFEKVNLHECSFQEETNVVSSKIVNTTMLGVAISDSTIENTVFEDSHLNHSTFQDAQLVETKFIKSAVFKSSIWNCLLDRCTFRDVDNDFDLHPDSIEMCLINHTKFENTFVTSMIKKWNGINEDAKHFNERIIMQVWEKSTAYTLQYIDNLHAVTTAASNLEKISQPNSNVTSHIYEIFARLIRLSKEMNDIIAFGKVIEYLGNIHPDWRVGSNQFLPSPVQVLPKESYLKLTFNNTTCTLSDLKHLITDLESLEESLHPHIKGEFKVLSITTGSVIIEISSNTLLIVAVLSLLWKGINALYEFNGKRLSNKETALKIKDLQSAEKKRSEYLDLKIKELEKEQKELENQKLKDEILELRKRNQQLLLNETNINVEEILPLNNLQLSKANADAIIEKYGELDVHAIFNMDK